MTKIEQKFKYLQKEKSSFGEINIFHFKGLSVARNCLGLRLQKSLNSVFCKSLFC